MPLQTRGGVAMEEEDQTIILMAIETRAQDLRRTLMQRSRRLEERIMILTALPSTAPYLAHNSAAQSTHHHFIFSDNNQNLITERRIIRRRTQQQQQQPSLPNLEKIQIQDGEQGSDCSICLIELSVGAEAIRLPNPCSHVYHQDCIMRWLNTSKTCPLCRRPVV